MPHSACPGDDMVELPLRAVQVVGVAGLAGFDPDDLHIEGVAFHQISRARLAAERLGDFLAGPGEFSFR